MNIITGERVTTTEPDETISMAVAKVAIEFMHKADKFTDDDLYDQPELEDYALAYVRETGTCGVCHRTLTDPESVALGIGPICRQGI
jgi:hypothetical protein